MYVDLFAIPFSLQKKKYECMLINLLYHSPYKQKVWYMLIILL